MLDAAEEPGNDDNNNSSSAADTTAAPSAQACRVGRPAPAFAVPAVLADGSIDTVSLSDYKDRYLAILFYPADFTFVCPTEITSFSDHAGEFARSDCDLVVCSTDSEFVHYNWRLQGRKDGGVGEIAVPMLADRTRQMSRDYGVLSEETGQAFRGLFIIDPSQKLRVAIVNDMPVGRSVQEALRLVQALKYSDEHGEVCPANWHKGDAAIKPTIGQSKAFFAQQQQQQ
ncbi:thioredoxin-like protein [Martensiomyces pterosporus]|nr:thioredoxin-like protein [Martensiomyces pterosporus]